MFMLLQLADAAPQDQTTKASIEGVVIVPTATGTVSGRIFDDTGRHARSPKSRLWFKVPIWKTWF
jgi:hypothetical protein